MVRKNEYWEKRTYFYLVFLVLLSASLFYQSTNLPLMDELAEIHMSKIIREEVITEIKTKSPYAPTQGKQIDSIFENVMKEEQTEKDIEEYRTKLKSYYKDEKGVPYMYKYDGYYYLRQADNLLRKRTLGEYDLRGAPVDDLRYAPSVSPLEFNLLPHFILRIYQIARNDPHEGIEVGGLWISLIFGVLSVVLLYLIASLLFNREIGFIAGIAFSLHPLVFDQFKAGIADTPPINVFLTLVLIFTFVKAFEATHEKGKRYEAVSYAGASLLSLWVFKQVWTGYFYPIFIIIGFLFLYYTLKAIKERNKKILLVEAIFLVLVLIQASKSWLVKRGLQRLNLVKDSSFFPTGWDKVSELQPMSFLNYVQAHGEIFLIFALIGAFVIVKDWKTADEKSLVLSWVVMAVTPLMSVKFITYGVPPLAILFGVGTYHSAKQMSKIDIKLKESYRLLLWALVILCLFFANLQPNLATSMYKTPFMDDAIYATAMEIKERTDKGTIITTWWDYGYLYEYYARRPVTIDGGNFQSQRLYWTSKSLLSKNENETKGILRMLNCEGEEAIFKELSKEGDVSAIDKIMKVVIKNKGEAQKYYKEIGKEELIDLTHCDSKGIVILSLDMLPKINTIDHFNKWNFEYGVTFSVGVNMNKGDCFMGDCGMLKYDLDKKEVLLQGQIPREFISIGRNFNNKTIIENEKGVPVTILLVEEDYYIIEPGLEDSFLMRGLFFNDFENFELFSLKDMRKRIVAYSY